MTAPQEIVDRQKFKEVLERATKKTAALRAAVPDWPILDQIEPQLDFMRDCLDAGRIPTVDEKKSITLGPLAVRNIEDGNPEYADWLKELAFAFRRLEALP